MTRNSPEILPLPCRPTNPEAAPTVLVVAAAETAQQLADCVQSCGLSARTVESVSAAAQSITAAPFDVCLIGPLPATESLGDLAAELERSNASTQIVQVVDAPPTQQPRLLPHSPGVELLQEPFSPAHLGSVLHNAVERSRLLAENRRLKRQLTNRSLREMVGQSAAMRTLRQQIQAVADSDAPVLLTGEPGTGIDLVAQAIHDASRRAHRSHIKVDCRVLSAEALEHELFGSEASNAGIGRSPTRLELANGGTLFLDAVETIALPVQRRLWQVVSEQRFHLVGTNETVRFDARIVAGTHMPLAMLLEGNLVRPEWLNYLRQHCITLPPLRERLDDLGLLVESFLRQIAVREGRPIRSLALDALTLLQSHDWPGNLRELQNVIERACGMDWGQRLTAAMLRPWIFRASPEDLPADGGLTLREMERKLIETTFVRFAGNRERTARALDIGIRTLSGKLREYGYPPRGGPGSNQPALRLHTEDIEKKAA